MSTEEDSLFPDRKERPAAGCLPLFMIPALAAFGAFLWFAPVETPEPVQPIGRGTIDYRSGHGPDFIFSLRHPLPLPFLGSASDEALQVELPPAQKPAMLPPPVMGDIPTMPQSTVLLKQEGAMLPVQDNNGKEPQP